DHSRGEPDRAHPRGPRRRRLPGARVRDRARAYFFRFAATSITFISGPPAGSTMNISNLKLLSSAQVMTSLAAIFLPDIGSNVGPEVMVRPLHGVSQLPVEFMIPVPMLSTQELTYFPVVLS